MKKIAEHGTGVVIFLRNTPGEGDTDSIFGNASPKPADIWKEDGKIITHRPPDGTMSYGLGAQILRDLGIKKMRILSNKGGTFKGISNYGLEIIEKIPF